MWGITKWKLHWFQNSKSKKLLAWHTIILMTTQFEYIYIYLLYRQECFTGKYTARKIHTKLHPGPEWRIFHILTSEDIDDVISRSFTVVCANSRWKIASDRFVYIIKRKLHGGLKIWILFSRVKNNILLTRAILFWPLENKIHIFVPPCNILYIYTIMYTIYIYIYIYIFIDCILYLHIWFFNW